MDDKGNKFYFKYAFNNNYNSNYYRSILYVSSKNTKKRLCKFIWI